MGVLPKSYFSLDVAAQCG